MQLETVIVTGASSGVGHVVATQLLAQGKRVILMARRTEPMVALANQYRGQAHVYQCDVSVAQQVAATMQVVLERFATIDAIVHCAGFGIFANAVDTPIEQVEGMLLTNVSGGIHLNQLLLPQFKQQGYGHIMMIASVAGKIGTPKSSVYAASKFALVGYTDALRMEVAADGIFVTTINPGPIETPFFEIADPSGEYLKNIARFSLTPEQVATKMVRFLGKKKREVNLPLAMAFAARVHAFFPRTVEAIAKPFFLKK